MKDYKYLDKNSISSQLEHERAKPESIVEAILALVSAFALLYSTIEIFTLIERWSI